MPEQIVDWTTFTHEPRAGKSTRVYRVTCMGCGYTRTLRKPDAKKAERTGGCFPCSQKAKAAQGFAAMADRWGHRWAMRHVQAHREANPSKPEQTMAALLDDLGVDWRREVPLTTKSSGRKKRVYLLDFVVSHAGREWAIEVDGVYFHTTNPRTMRNDKLKTRLLKRRNFPLLRVTDDDLKHGRAEQMVIAYLGLDLTTAADDEDGWDTAWREEAEKAPQFDHAEVLVTTRSEDFYPEGVFDYA